MGEGEDESEIPAFRGGSLIWHWGATRDDLGMPGLPDWSQTLARNQLGPPTYTPIPPHTHTQSGALGGQSTLGAQMEQEGASQEAGTLTPERMAPTFLPACPGSWAKGRPVPSGRTWSLPTPRSPEGSQGQVCERARGFTPHNLRAREIYVHPGAKDG